MSAKLAELLARLLNPIVPELDSLGLDLDYRQLLWELDRGRDDERLLCITVRPEMQCSEVN